MIIPLLCFVSGLFMGAILTLLEVSRTLKEMGDSHEGIMEAVHKNLTATTEK